MKCLSMAETQTVRSEHLRKGNGVSCVVFVTIRSLHGLKHNAS